MKHRIIGIFTLILTAGLFSCEEDDPVLPAITMEGKNTYGCFVNGELWLPEGRGGGSPFFVDMTVKNFISVNTDNDNSGMKLIIQDSTGIKVNYVYPLNNHPTSYSQYHLVENTGGDMSACFYDPEHVITGSLILTRLDNIVSGTFEFISYNAECGDTIKVTDGRFDIGTITR